MRKQEERFENRMVHLLERHGFRVINCARSKPFDLVAFGQQTTYLIELKGKNGRLNEKQSKMQAKFIEHIAGNVVNVLIQQAKKRGKIHLCGDSASRELTFKLSKYIVRVNTDAN